MTISDPFASAPAEEAQTEVPPAEEPRTVGTVKVAVKPDFQGFNDSKVVLTLKGGSGFDAPWIVIHATDAADALGQLDETMLSLMEKAQNAAQHFSGLAPAKTAGSANVSQGSAPPRGATEPPPGTPPAPGPDWTYKTGVGKTGKAWKAWMPPRGSDAQPVWL